MSLSNNLKVRIDKWMWCVRIFKSRTIATDFCKTGKIKVNDINAKASTEVKKGDLVIVKKGGFNFTFQVIETIDKRVGAPIAALCYENKTPPEELLKYDNWLSGNMAGEFRDRGTGRPTKKERRDIDAYKDNFFWFDE
jgi:ribosome-associated heat shock protein Hsp15